VICGEDEKDWVEGASQPNGSEDDTKELENESHEDKECNNMNVSVLLAGEMTHPQTMKLQGEVMGKKVLFLIDSGTSHNFISKEMVHNLNLAVKDTPAYSVKLRDRFRKSTRGCCKEMRVKIGDHIIKDTLCLN